MKTESTHKNFRHALLAGLILLVLSVFLPPAQNAEAQSYDPVYNQETYTPPPIDVGIYGCCGCFGCCDCGCACCIATALIHGTTQTIIGNEHRHLAELVFGNTAGILAGTAGPTWEVPEPPPNVNRLHAHERFLLLTFWWEYLLPSFMMMTEQFVTAQMEQMFIIGTFLDAKMQLESQQLVQELAARAHKDYHPSFQMCEFGSNARSLSAAEFKGDLTRMVLNKQFMDRQLGVGASVGAGGPETDRLSDEGGTTPTPHNRLGFFLNSTCDRRDLNHTLGRAVTGLWLCTAVPRDNGWINRDIDWNNTVMGPRVINVDYAVGDAYTARGASDNYRLFQMSNYLYGHDVFSRPDGTLLESEANMDDFIDSRSVTAKRSVAQNSFNNIVALKSRGTHMDDPGSPRVYSSENTFEFMRLFMVELGFPLSNAAQYRRYLFQKDEALEPPGAGEPERDEMSYYAQMEVLAKKLYQRPEFYTQLYDKPANTKRKSAAMQAIKLMLDRDIFESQLRSEAIMSMILEIKIVEEQKNVENKLGLMKEETR